ncbi:8694_t:CDS:2, partial [Cetraspora pellucida]
DYLLSNYEAKEGIGLLNVYAWKELINRLVIQVKQDSYYKYSVVDISQKAVIDIDASQENIESEKVNAKDPFLKMPAWINCDSPLIATEVYKEQYVEPLSNEGNIYVGLPWETGKTHTLEHLTISDNKVVSVISQAHTHLAGQLREHLYKLIHENGLKAFVKINPSKLSTTLTNLRKQISLLPFDKQKSASLICHLRKNVQEIICALKTDFPGLCIKNYHSKSNLVEKAYDFSNIEEA